ncbi:MAG: ribonuclease VapC, partial [Promethearchaeota archaeon]
DYSMENLCSVLDIPFSPLIKKGIKSKIIWEVYCPICSKVYNAEDLNNPCEICGLKLKRRPKK